MQPDAPVHIIHNPVAGRGRTADCAESARRAFERRGFRAVLWRTEARGHATRLVAGLRSEAAAFVAVGGDGTLNEVVNGLDGATVPVGLLPCGTGNDYARMLQLPGTDAAADLAAAVLAAGTARRMDLVRIVGRDSDGAALLRYCVNTMGVGFDAAVALQMQRRRVGGGIAAYLVAVLRTLRSYRSAPARVHASNGATAPPPGLMLLASVGNGTTSGGGFRLTPAALPDDGLLDLCHVRHARPARILAVLPRAMRGAHGSAPEVTFLRAPAFEITLERPLPAHLDGEILSPAALWLTATVVPGALRLLAP